MKNLLKRIFSLEFLRFILIGIINTFSTTLFASLLDGRMNDKLAFVIGYVIGIVISFFLNTFFTFREKPTWSKALRFPLTSIPNFLFQFFFVFLFIDVLGISSWPAVESIAQILSVSAQELSNTIAYMFAAVIALPVTFIFMRAFVYRKKLDQ